MARKIKIDDNTYECPACNYRWSKTMGMADLSFDEDEHCPCCPDCGELIEDGDDYEYQSQCHRPICRKRPLYKRYTIQFRFKIVKRKQLSICLREPRRRILLHV